MRGAIVGTGRATQINFAACGAGADLSAVRGPWPGRAGPLA
jgi:hypothetical protein